MPGGPEGRHLWADDVEEDEAEERQQRRGSGGDAAAGGSMGGGSRGWNALVEEAAEEEGVTGFEARDGWHEGMQVERGASRQRLDLQHGFIRDIVSGCRQRSPLPRVVFSRGAGCIRPLAG